MLRLLPFWAIRTMRLRTTLCELGSLFVDAPSRERVLDIGSGRHHFLSKTSAPRKDIYALYVLETEDI